MTSSAPTEIVAALRRNDRFLVTTHIGPDGDAIGSVLATVELLKSIGKSDIWVFHAEGTPRAHHAFIDREWRSHLPDDLEDRLAVVLDTSSAARTGEPRLVEAAETIVIDHHLTNTGFGSLNFVDASAASTTEILAELFDSFAVPWTPRIASLIFLGIYTDTEALHNRAATDRATCIARRCLSLVEHPENLLDEISRVPPAWDRYLERALEKTAQEESVVVVALDREDLAHAGVDPLDGLAAARHVIGHLPGEVVAVIGPHASDEQHVELRSRRPDIDVARIASSRGGGGHQAAAGFAAPNDNAVVLAAELRSGLEAALNRD